MQLENQHSFIKWGEDEFIRDTCRRNRLERGYTIQGLTVSFIVRKSGTDDSLSKNLGFLDIIKTM